MKLAICAPFMESDLWQERLRRAAPRAALEFDEFYCPEEIRSVPGFRYDAGVVAMKGARGLELATALRERSCRPAPAVAQRRREIRPGGL